MVARTPTGRATVERLDLNANVMTMASSERLVPCGGKAVGTHPPLIPCYRKTRDSVCIRPVAHACGGSAVSAMPYSRASCVARASYVGACKTVNMAWTFDRCVLAAPGFP